LVAGKVSLIDAQIVLVDVNVVLSNPEPGQTLLGSGEGQHLRPRVDYHYQSFTGDPDDCDSERDDEG
jgi:hypothetical protein